MAKENSFGKAEKLTNVKAIKQLFSAGKSVKVAPLAVCYHKADGTKKNNTQILVSVGKRYFKHAVDRNRLKRLIREAYRLNKKEFLSNLPSQTYLNIAFIYQSYRIADYKTIENAVKISLTMIAEKLTIYN